MSNSTQILEALHQAEDRLAKAIEAKKSYAVIQVYENSVKYFQEAYIKSGDKSTSRIVYKTQQDSLDPYTGLPIISEPHAPIRTANAFDVDD